MKQPAAKRSAKQGRAKRKHHERDRRGQREAGPCRQSAEISGAHQPDGKADLTARRTGQKLAQGDEIGIGLFVEPAAPRDELVAEISDMRDRSPEAGQAKLEKDEQNLDDGALLRIFRLRRINCRRHDISLSRVNRKGRDDRSYVVEKRHKSEVHMQLLVTMK
jgi:hypothetical protein